MYTALILYEIVRPILSARLHTRRQSGFYKLFVNLAYIKNKARCVRCVLCYQQFARFCLIRTRARRIVSLNLPLASADIKVLRNAAGFNLSHLELNKHGMYPLLLTSSGKN